jgi:hypothetical protein
VVVVVAANGLRVEDVVGGCPAVGPPGVVGPVVVVVPSIPVVVVAPVAPVVEDSPVKGAVAVVIGDACFTRPSCPASP